MHFAGKAPILSLQKQPAKELFDHTYHKTENIYIVKALSEGGPYIRTALDLDTIVYRRRRNKQDR